MAWEDNLLEASLDGFIFDCIATDDKFARAHAVNTYPYLDGAEIEDLGAEPIPVAISAVFFGADYDARLQSFLKIIKTAGLRELQHPVFGKMQVQVVDVSVHHDADNIDQATVALNLLQGNLAPQFFEQTLAIQKASAIQQKNSLARAAATQVLAAEVLTIKNAGIFNRITQLRTSMTSALSALKAQIAGVISSGLDPIEFVSAWASDLTDVITAIVDLRGFDISTLTADWKTVFNAMDVAILLPTLARQPARDSAIIAAHVALEQASGKADAASIVLQSETVTPTLSAIEIEAMVNQARTHIQAVIALYRKTYAVDGSAGGLKLEKIRPITEALKDTALALQEAARAVIEARPPLVQRTMNAPGNYRLIAHKLYADHARASELFRLNPQVKMPNFIEQGNVLNAYAQ